MVTGQDVSCAHTITIEVVNIYIMQSKSNTMAVHLYSNYDTDVDVMRLLVILLPEHNMFCGSVTV